MSINLFFGNYSRVLKYILLKKVLNATTIRLNNTNEAWKKYCKGVERSIVLCKLKHFYAWFCVILVLPSISLRFNAAKLQLFFNSALRFELNGSSCKLISYFNRHLNRGCLVYMFSLRFSGSKFLINLRRQFRIRKIFRTQVFAGFPVFLFCV